MTNLQEAVIRYESGDFKQNEVKVIREMIKNVLFQRKINEKIGIMKDLRIASTNALIQADEILETVPVLPSINFEQCQSFNDYNLEPLTSINYFILKYNFYPYIEFGSTDELDTYDKEIKLLISTESGFWSQNNTLSLRIFNVSEINDGYGWRFTLQLFDFADGDKRLHFNNTVILSDYETFTFTCSSILRYQNTFSSPTTIDGQNYFGLMDYEYAVTMKENIYMTLDKCDLGIGNTVTTLRLTDEFAVRPTKQNLWNYETQSDVSSYYLPENFNSIQNEFITNIEVAFSYQNEHSWFGGLLLPDDEHFTDFKAKILLTDDEYFNDFKIKTDLMCTYEMVKFGSFMYAAISNAIYDKTVSTLEEEDMNLAAVLLRNDEIIFNRIENIPVMAMKTKSIDETIHSFIKNKIPYLRSIDYSYNWTNVDEPIARLTRAADLNPTYVFNEVMNADFSQSELIELTELHKVYEDDDTIILFRINITPIENVTVTGNVSFTGPFDVSNITTDRIVAAFKCYARARIGLDGVEITKIKVSIIEIIVMPKRSNGFGFVSDMDFKFVCGFGDGTKYFSINDSTGYVFNNTLIEYQGNLYYGYKANLSARNLNVVGVMTDDSFFDLTNTSDAQETVQISTPVNTSIKYETMKVLENYGFKATVGYRSATSSFQSASVVQLDVNMNAMDYLAYSSEIYLYDTDENQLTIKIKDLSGAKIDRCGYQYVWFGISGNLVYSALYPTNTSDVQTIVTSEHALANQAVIQQLLLGLEDLQMQFDDLVTRVEFLEAAFEEMNRRGPIFMQMIDMVFSFAGPISAAFDMVSVARQFAKDIVYQNKMNRLTIGQMKTSKALSEKDFNLSTNQNRNQYVDGYLHKNGIDRQVIYDNSNDRPYFLNGNEKVSQLDLAEKLDLMATVRTGGLIALDEINSETKALIRNVGPMNGLHPTFNVWARPLETLPRPIGSGLFKVGTNFSKLRRDNINKVFTTNTRLPFHTAGSFDDFNIVSGKPIRTRRWIGVGEPNIRHQTTNDKGAGIGGFKYDSELVGRHNGQLIWKHKPYNEETLSVDALESLYFTAFKNSHSHLSHTQKYDRLIGHTENRIGTSKLLYSYLPDSSFSNALDIFTNKVDLKYNLLNQNCQTLMLNLLNYSQSGQALTSLTSDTQAALIRARLDSIGQIIKFNQSLYSKILA